MNFSDYQILAFRTVANKRDLLSMENHALFGMVGEIGELNSLYQKTYQGHEFDEDHAKKEIGDLLWFIAEYCTAMEWSMDEVARLNIEKLKKRYPEGFEEERSLNREEGDI